MEYQVLLELLAIGINHERVAFFLELVLHQYSEFNYFHQAI